MGEMRDIYDSYRRRTGRAIERGIRTERGDYLLSVCVWIRNAEGKYLISRRSPEKPTFPNLWEPTGGGVLAGESSFDAAFREVKEELGITLREADGALFASQLRCAPVFETDSFEDIYLFRITGENPPITLQKGETCDAVWATQAEIRALLARGEFVPERYYPYLERLFSIG